MHAQSYSVEEYVADLRAAVSEETSEEAITDRIKPLAKRMADCKDAWFREEYRKTCPDQGFCLHLLHEEANHDLAVFVIAWAPGRGLGAHNHKTWAVVAGLEGQEHETNYRRIDDGATPGFADLEVTHEGTVTAGQVVCCAPEDIHKVWNNGERVAVSLHTYGRHLNHTGRSIFNPETKTEAPCVVKVED